MAEVANVTYPAQQYFAAKCIECPTLVGLIEDGEFGEFPKRPLAKDYVVGRIAQTVGSNYLSGCVSGPIFESGEDSEGVTCGMPDLIKDEI